MGILQELKEAKRQALEAHKWSNKPNPDCEDQCTNAKKSLLFIANHLNQEIDVTQIIIICAKCGKSNWKINKKRNKNKMPTQNHEYDPHEKSSARIIRSELDHNQDIRHYAETEEQYKILYTTILICIIIILIIIAGM